ncbi:hypothetical protein LXL04_013650 [Taraxacum kok-saghyz]
MCLQAENMTEKEAQLWHKRNNMQHMLNWETAKATISQKESVASYKAARTSALRFVRSHQPYLKL